MHGFTDLIQRLADNAGSFAPAAAAAIMVLGLALWLFGERLAKPAIMVLAALLGAVGGLIAIPSIVTTTPPEPSTVACACGGGLVVGALFGWIAYRWLLAAAMASAVAALAVTLTISGLHLQLSSAPAPAQVEATPDARAHLVVHVDQPAPTTQHPGIPIGPPLDPRAIQAQITGLTAPPEYAAALRTLASDRIRQALAAFRPAGDAPPGGNPMDAIAGSPLFGDLTRQAAAIPPRAQALLVLVTTLGWAAGMFIGMCAPRLTGRLLSAVWGAALALAGAAAVAVLMSPEAAARLPSLEGRWLAIWGGLVLAGIVAQTWMRRRARGSAPAGPVR